MAIYPCNFGHHRYPGRQSSAYVTHINGAKPSSWKARLCPKHVEHLTEMADLWLTPLDDSLANSLVCQRCDRPTTEHVYLTTFHGSSEGSSFVADFCDAHGAACLRALSIDAWAPR